MSPPDPSKIVASGKAEAPRSQEAVGKLISTNFGARYEGTFFQSFVRVLMLYGHSNLPHLMEHLIVLNYTRSRNALSKALRKI